MIDDPDKMIQGAWASPDGLIVIDEVREAGHVASFIDPDSGVETPFPRLPGNLVPIGRAADGAWVGLYYAANSPTELVRFDLDDPASATRELI